MTDIAFLIGRIIIGVYYIYNASKHLFVKTSTLTAYAGSKGVPMPRIAIYASGLLLLIGGLSFLLGFLPVVGVIAIVLFYIPVSFWMHDFWAVSDPDSRANQRINFGKNMALMGSSLMFLLIPEPWPLSLGG